jgi:phosphate acetyltransferase
MFAFTRDQVLRYRSEGNMAHVIDTIIQKFKQLEKNNDFVVVEGTDFMGEGLTFEFDANISIAKNLGIPVILVIKGDNNSPDEVATNLLSTYTSFRDRDVQILVTVANKIQPSQVTELQEIFKKRLPSTVLSTIIPLNKDLANPTMKEITEMVKGKLLFGENLLSNQVDHSIVGAMQLQNLLTRLKENTLIVTPGDRGDIIIAALQANISKSYPKVAGMILTGGLEPDEPIVQLVKGLENVVPIMQVESGTFETVNLVGSTQSRIYSDNKLKIDLAINTFEKYMDTKSIEDKMVTFRSEVITPRMFQYQLVTRAKSRKKHIVLPEGNDDRVLTAAARLINQEVVDLTILGIKEDITAAVKRLNLKFDLDKIQIIDPATS